MFITPFSFGQNYFYEDHDLSIAILEVQELGQRNTWETVSTYRINYNYRLKLKLLNLNCENYTLCRNPCGLMPPVGKVDGGRIGNITVKYEIAYVTWPSENYKDIFFKRNSDFLDTHEGKTVYSGIFKYSGKSLSLDVGSLPIKILSSHKTLSSIGFSGTLYPFGSNKGASGY